jgi:hypothetical protein
LDLVLFTATSRVPGIPQISSASAFHTYNHNKMLNYPTFKYFLVYNYTRKQWHFCVSVIPISTIWIYCETYRSY